jgi:hypothetical protein
MFGRKRQRINHDGRIGRDEYTRVILYIFPPTGCYRFFLVQCTLLAATPRKLSVIAFMD